MNPKDPSRTEPPLKTEGDKLRDVLGKDRKTAPAEDRSPAPSDGPAKLQGDKLQDAVDKATGGKSN